MIGGYLGPSSKIIQQVTLNRKIQIDSRSLNSGSSVVFFYWCGRRLADKRNFLPDSLLTWKRLWIEHGSTLLCSGPTQGRRSRFPCCVILAFVINIWSLASKPYISIFYKSLMLSCLNCQKTTYTKLTAHTMTARLGESEVSLIRL